MAKRGRKFQPLQQWLTLHPSDPPLGLIDLPADLTENILQRLGPVEILEIAQNVCATWRTVCQDPNMWRVIDMRYDHHPRFRRLRRFLLYRLFRSTCRRAVDHSKGELIDINIEHFGDDDLLLYISDRSSHLKCLRIENCNSISVSGLTAAVTKFPELEELHSNLCIFSDDIQTIGNCCPMLKSFTFKYSSHRGRVKNNKCALAIARNMPNLRHLGVSGNALGDGGVKAILDGCPRLESIDFRGCVNVHLDKRLCFESIHDLRLLFDHSTADFYNQWDDEDENSDRWSWLTFDYCFGSDDERYYIDDDDDDYDDEDDDDDLYSSYSIGYYYFGDYAGQLEVDYWDAIDLSKKGKFVHCNFPIVEVIKPFSLKVF